MDVRKITVLGRVVSAIFIGLASGHAVADTVVMQKQNTGYSIDGNKGSTQELRQVYLFHTSLTNVNQQWVEISYGDNFYAYQKKNTSLCLDGGRGGETGQAVILFRCDSANQNQHWLKVPTGGNSYRLAKRNAQDFSIDGNKSAEDGQGIYLWNSDSNNQNQRWEFSVVETSTTVEPIINPSDYTVSSLGELREAVQRSNQDIVMMPGTYSIAELSADEQHIPVSGNNNTIDLRGVTIEFPVNLGASVAHFYFSGSGNTLRGGTIENTYGGNLTRVIDFVSYNEDRDNLAKGGKPHMVIAGNDTTIIDTRMIVRGSFPYGYGSYLGINGNNSFGLAKRGGIQVNSTNTVLDGVELIMGAFGHGIYIGPGEGAVSDNTIIRNTVLEGRWRSTNDMLSERNGLMEMNNFLDADGNAIQANDAESLGEDGIRTYPDSGSVFVENTTVTGMRSGMRLYNASEATVTNSTVLDNRIANFQMSRDDEVTSSSANFSIGPAIWVSGFRQGQDIDITLLPSPDALGDHNIADIDWGDNTIILRRSPGPRDSDEDRVIMVSSDNNTITNFTEYTIELASGTSGNTISSAGRVIDNGSNDVTSIDLEL